MFGQKKEIIKKKIQDNIIIIDLNIDLLVQMNGKMQKLVLINYNYKMKTLKNRIINKKKFKLNKEKNTKNQKIKIIQNDNQ